MKADPEIVAISAFNRAMFNLPDERSRERVLKYIEAKHINIPAEGPHTAAVAVQAEVIQEKTAVLGG